MTDPQPIGATFRPHRSGRSGCWYCPGCSCRRVPIDGPDDGPPDLALVCHLCRDKWIRRNGPPPKA